MSERDGTRPRAIGRRRFLYLSGLAATGVVATACGGGAPLPGQTPTAPSPAAQATVGGAQPTAAQPTAAARPTGAAQQPVVQPTAAAAPKAFKEAPQLAQLVKDGKLAPVAERLPKTPLVVQPVEMTGRYGGTWRNALVGGADLAQITLTIGYEHLVRWDTDWKEVIPNVAETYEVNSDGTEYTFKLREGHKWSDGKPFTADDIMFWYEDVSLDKELNPGGLGSWLRAGGKPVVVEKVGPYTVKFKFAAPNGLFLQNLAQSDGAGVTAMPKHYLQQFHKKYNTTNLDQLVKDNGAENWVKLFQSKGTNIPGTQVDARYYNKDLPTLWGWQITAPFTGTTRVTAERNPYYFKVDPDGNQLPYIDRATYDVLQEQEVLLLKAINGEIDFIYTKVNTLQNKAVLADNQKKGNYRFVEVVGSSMNGCIIALNMNHKDPVKRQIFQNKDFRIGLSHAINRQEIIDVVYVGQGEPWQAAPRRESAFFNERLAKQYTEFDLKRANEHLDKAFPRKDGSGIRLGPDGKPISFQVDVAGTVSPSWLDTMNLVKPMWQKVGVDIQVKTIDRSLFYTRKDTNEHDANVWGGDGGLRDAILDPRWYFPYNNESLFAQAWRYWYNPPGQLLLQPEEPPEAVKQQMQLYDQIKATVDEDKHVALFKDILAIAQDQFYVMGIVLNPPGYAAPKNNFRNVPAKMLGAWRFQNPAVYNSSQFFFQS